ncbi:hypothetical protein [Paenibacillus terrae]|uniref:Uncharacterized protein n=1 Tax=Paenibacillus terrae TaxID=159743 RepID=A0A0D7WWP0_9BACL|nr:hypothetical protein [Paenibacillus terrae]KJD43601.1 hypothetical protein QD47_21635 [Paenibacillus terrae]
MDGIIELELDLGEGDIVDYPSQEVRITAKLTAIYDREDKKIFSLEIDDDLNISFKKINNFEE